MANALLQHLQKSIRTAGGWLAFDDYLQIVLHHPQFGYYGSGRVRFGSNGDFYTAPTISPLFGDVIAEQLSPILTHCNDGILELGGGNGSLAEQILSTLNGKHIPYTILETSGALRQRQQERLQRFGNIRWLNALPKSYDGVILANEVLDCVPFRMFIKYNGSWLERGVIVNGSDIAWQDSIPKDSAWQKLATFNLPDSYQTEINPQASALVNTLVRILRRGCLLLIDYGFEESIYYHPQRTMGTMMCHHRQQTDAKPLTNIGNKDITAHVNFTDVANAGIAAGGKVLGYATQAKFLINGGITERLAAYYGDTIQYAKLAAGVNKLLLPHEMGELFKCLALGKGDAPIPTAFTTNRI